MRTAVVDWFAKVSLSYDFANETVVAAISNFDRCGPFAYLCGCVPLASTTVGHGVRMYTWVIRASLYRLSVCGERLRLFSDWCEDLVCSRDVIFPDQRRGSMPECGLLPWYSAHVGSCVNAAGCRCSSCLEASRRAAVFQCHAYPPVDMF